jgi:acetyl-CoA acetyltransferase
VRTPRGKGKKDGSLHTVKPVDLPVTLMQLEDAQRRFPNLENYIDDMVLGCVTPVGDQGLHCQDRGAEGRLERHHCRCATQPLLRLRPRSREHGRA